LDTAAHKSIQEMDGRSRRYGRRTEETYCQWVKRFIYFHHLRHPAEMAEPEINAFLTHLAVKNRVSFSTQNQALSALLFLYRHVLGREMASLDGVIRARKPKRLSVVMTRDEVRAVLDRLRAGFYILPMKRNPKRLKPLFSLSEIQLTGRYNTLTVALY
jgi:site-specific recombinase XerD